MAIYTNYGRYLKAKQFKEFLEDQGDTYMVFGLGNPRWDYPQDSEKYQSPGLPNAPYNTAVINSSVYNNQFLDTHSKMWFLKGSGSDRTVSLFNRTSSSSATGYDLDFTSPYLEACQNIIPPFPCIWQNYDSNETLLPGVTQNTYHQFYIKEDDGVFKLYNAGTVVSNITMPSESEEQQYFSELYLRGLALDFAMPAAANNWKRPDNTTGSLEGIALPGLLGAVKCGVSFVKDIGDEINNSYDGNAKQFWYGDRYWEIVEPDETYLERYIDAGSNQEIYPHHLIITATVNPRSLCANLMLDQAIVPRQIAIYTKKRPENAGATYVAPRAYRVGEYIFNFGQYTVDELPDAAATDAATKAACERVLNFTLPCKTSEGTANEKEYPNGDFKFILHDYIKGSVREDKHAIDRFGYVIGF